MQSHSYHLANPELNDTLKYIKGNLSFVCSNFSTKIASQVVTKKKKLAGNRAETAENEPILLGRRLICQIFALLSTKNEVPPNW